MLASNTLILPYGTGTFAPFSTSGPVIPCTGEVSPDRPANLRRPLDDKADQGAHGMFDRQAGGFWDPTFLQWLPKTARLFATAVASSAAEKARTFWTRIARRAH